MISSNHWSRHAFDINVKNNHVTSNKTESFNSEFNLPRGEPVLTLLEHTKRKIMKKIQKRKKKAIN